MTDPIRINRIENKPLKVKAMAPVIRDTTPDYEGPYTVEPSTTSEVVLQTSNKRMRQDVTVERATLEELNVSVTENGETRIEAEEGYLGLSGVNLTTNVQPDLESKSVEYNTNGDFTVRPSEGKDGLSEVNVRVSVEALPIVPTDAVIFYSENQFSLYTNNRAKNWDGTLYYSTDYSSWNIWNGSDMLTSAKTGLWHKLYLRGSGNTGLQALSGVPSISGWKFVGGVIKCRGNLNNLLDTIQPSLGLAAFQYLFYNVINVDFDITLPATTLTGSCYFCMFLNCASLTTVPELPATTLADYCYQNMFGGCTSLVTASELPATTLKTSCYHGMFQGCSSLTNVPKILGTLTATSACRNMFSSCTSLISLPKLYSLSLSGNVYNSMFSGCSQIKLSTEQTGEYQTPYRMPIEGTGSAQSSSLTNMFLNTGGTFTGTPAINTTYYTSNEVI